MTLTFPVKYSVTALILLTIVGCRSLEQTHFAPQAQYHTKQQQRLLSELLEKESNTELKQEPDSVMLLSSLINEPALDAYINSALQHNPSLQQSLTALKVAYAQQGITSSSLLPSVNGGFSAQVDEVDDASQNKTYATEITVAWELDLWQKLANTNSAALKDIVSSQANVQAAKNLLVANVMRAWLDLILQQQLVSIESQRLITLDNNQALILARYKAGLGSLEDWDNAKASRDSTKATLAKYQQQWRESRRHLHWLTGRTDDDSTLPQESDLASFPAVITPLNSASVHNLAGRPDLQSAFANIEAQTLRANAAYKAMLPSISLSASLKDMAQSPSEALLTGPLWSALGQISAPLFQGGKLKSEAELADLNAEMSYWLYQEALLKAVNEVENAVDQESSLSTQQQHQSAALASAQRSFTSYEQKYRQGIVDILALLSVQQQTYDLQTQLTNTLYNRLNNRIDLGLALGLGVSS
ncbi:TolC family protein [Shewanella sp.]|nr:TolC family protein [Shewanella sp.]